jgi:hypothetical protein
MLQFKKCAQGLLPAIPANQKIFFCVTTRTQAGGDDVAVTKIIPEMTALPRSIFHPHLGIFAMRSVLSAARFSIDKVSR